MRVSTERQKIRFTSGDTECAAWHYPGTNGACVIMTGGFAVTKEPGTDLFARRFHEAGFAVLAFDYRHLGRERRAAAPGQRVARAARRLAGRDRLRPDAARSRPGQARGLGLLRLGGHVFRVAARNPDLAAAIAQTPNADGLAAARNAARHQKPLAMLRFAGRGVARRRRRPGWPAAAAGAAGRGAGHRRPAHDAGRAGRRPGAQPGDRYPDWRQEVAARSALRLGFYRPGRYAARVAVPAAGPGLRPGPVRAGRARRPRRAPGAAGRAGPDARRALRAVPGRRTSGPSRPNCPSCAGTCPSGIAGQRAGARAGAARAAGMKRSSCPPGRSSTRTPAATGRCWCCCTG